MKKYSKKIVSLTLAFMLVGTMFAGLFVTTEIFVKTASATGGTFGGGNGTTGNPYIIEDVDDLQNMSANLSAHYVLGNDIDAGNTTNWNLGAGFEPVGNATTPFNGTFNGAGYVISGLFIDRPTTDDVGLFGMVGTGQVSNVTLLDADVTGDTRVGILAGRSDGHLRNISTYGKVAGVQTVGGLSGNNKGLIDNCTSSSSVTATTYNSGGLLGYISAGEIKDCYATGQAWADGGIGRVGGLIGYSVGGLISRCYSSGPVYGLTNFGGLVGLNGAATFSYCFFDNVTSGLTTSAGGAGVTGLNTTDMMKKSTFDGAAWDTSGVWWIRDAGTRPFLRMEHSYRIHTSHQLQLVCLEITGHYTLERNLNLSDIRNPASMWGTSDTDGKGFFPLGDEGSTFFDGVFDGKNHTISQLFIDDPDYWFVGLFRVPRGDLKNIILEDFEVTAKAWVGALFGFLNGEDPSMRPSVINCHVRNGSMLGNAVRVGALGGEVVASDIEGCSASNTIVMGRYQVGGLLGRITDFPPSTATLVNDCWADCTVRAAEYSAGGFCGMVDRAVWINNSWSAGTVIGEGDYIGGFIGSVLKANFFNCHSTADVTGEQEVGGFAGVMDTGAVPYSVHVYNCSSSGLVRGGNCTGGFAGRIDGASQEIYIENCSTTSPVSVFPIVIGESAFIRTDVGGFAGLVEGPDVSIKDCFSAGYVGMSINRGGFIGEFTASPATLENNYWDIETSGPDRSIGSGTATGITGKSTADLMTQAAFSRNFSTVWNIDEGLTYPFPRIIYPSMPKHMTGALFSEDGTTPVTPLTRLNLAVNGEYKNRAYSGANGFYYRLFRPETYTSDDMLLLYTVDGLAGNNTLLRTDQSISFHDIIANGGVYMENLTGAADFDYALMSLARDDEFNEDMLYSIAGNCMTVNGTRMETASGTPIILNGDIVFSNTGSLNFGGDVTLGTDVVFLNATGAGGVSFRGEVDSNAYPRDLVIVTGGEDLKFLGDAGAAVGLDTIEIGTSRGITTLGTIHSNSFNAMDCRGCFDMNSGALVVAGTTEIHADDVQGTISTSALILDVTSANITGTINGKAGSAGADEIVLLNYVLMNTTFFDGVDLYRFAPADIDTATEDVMYFNAYDANYPASETVTWGMETNASGWLSINSSTGVLSGTPGNSDVGLHWVNVTVLDAYGGLAWSNFTLTVINVNDPPEITTTPATTATQDMSYFQALTAYDPDFGDVLMWTLLAGPAWLTLNATTWTLEGTPGNADVGSSWVEVKVEDLLGANDTLGFMLTVNNVNDPPAITTVPVTTATQDVPYSAVYQADDPDGDAIAWTLVTNATWLTMTSNHLHGTPLNEHVGTYWVNVSVADGNGGTDSTNFTLTVQNVNDPPVITTVAVTEAVEGVPYSVNCAAIDIDGDTLTWAVVTNATWLTMSAAGTLSGTPEPGIFAVNFTVSDGNGGADYSAFTLTAYSDSNGNGIPDYMDPEFLTVVEYNNATAWNNQTVNQTVWQNSTNNVTIGVSDADSDGDGWSDAVEILAGTDPLDATDMPLDADGNGIADFMEPDDAETVTVTETPAWAWGAVIAAIAFGILAALGFMRGEKPNKMVEKDAPDAEEGEVEEER